LIDLREMLPSFVEQYLVKENVPADVIRLELSGLATLCFDRSHFHQVLWNLLSNALRHSQVLAGSVRMLVFNAKVDGQVELHVIDDGEGVGDEWREQIFEPFFTTHHRGTGLGLYIARELCDANGAQLELLSLGQVQIFVSWGGLSGVDRQGGTSSSRRPGTCAGNRR
jgi:two-component system sensor histidine kinase PilS (NtrC family)